MGKGLIPADLETWKPRRRAVVPAFHAAWLDSMARMFGDVALRSAAKLEAVAGGGGGAGGVVDMEQEFLSFGLDVIGLGVFNYDFGSITAESPVIRAVYGVLKEAEHRSTFYIPYWNLPLADVLVPRQRAFRADLAVINACLDDLIDGARSTRTLADADALAARDYSKVSDPSLLRFLVDARGADLGDRQLRDDLMTMLIAGHETTAAVLTWTLLCLSQDGGARRRAVAEVDAAVGDRPPGVADIPALPWLRACLSESLRLYPQPPILIRRALDDDVLPAGLSGDPNGYPIGAGADIFISVWNLHRSPHLWKEPDAFRPDRFAETNANPAFGGAWAGYRPEAQGSSLYPNEVSSDFAFIPFGGGARKCFGDQVSGRARGWAGWRRRGWPSVATTSARPPPYRPLPSHRQFAMMEAVIMLAVLLRRFEFELVGGLEGVGMATGATIHTANGLRMRVTRREGVGAAGAGAAAAGAGTA